VFAPLVGELAVNSPGSIGWKFARPADKPHTIAQLSVKQIIGNFVIWFHRGGIASVTRLLIRKIVLWSI
jgi:hypothetical protein